MRRKAGVGETLRGGDAGSGRVGRGRGAGSVVAGDGRSGVSPTRGVRCRVRPGFRRCPTVGSRACRIAAARWGLTQEENRQNSPSIPAVSASRSERRSSLMSVALVGGARRPLSRLPVSARGSCCSECGPPLVAERRDARRPSGRCARDGSRWTWGGQYSTGATPFRKSLPRRWNSRYRRPCESQGGTAMASRARQCGDVTSALFTASTIGSSHSSPTEPAPSEGAGGGARQANSSLGRPPRAGRARSPARAGGRPRHMSNGGRPIVHCTGIRLGARRVETVNRRCGPWR